MTPTTATNASFIGRLLEEISWEGASVRGYRDGGRGRENVLTAEVLLPLSYLPREEFLGEVLRTAHGADVARARVAAEMEQAEVTLLPDESRLPGSGIVVQPDAVIVSPTTHVLIEAKRIRASAFQGEQLAREYVSLLDEAGQRTPLLLLVLGSPPPVRVKGLGLLEPADAIASVLDDVLLRAPGIERSRESLLARVDEVVAWTMWTEIREVVTRAAISFSTSSSGLDGTVRRLSRSVTDAIDWHA